MTEDEKAAEAYAQKHNDPKIDWDVMTQEQTQALLERVSCDGCRHNFKALSLAFLAGVEHARPRWVSVEEGLPEEKQQFVILKLKDGSRAIDEWVCFFSGDKTWDFRNNSGWTHSVVAWMPLPQEPKV